MDLTFDTMLARVLRHEGGYSNNPKDPGGATNYGVTQAVYDVYRDDATLPRRSVLHITKAEVREIYFYDYFEAVRGPQLPAAVAFQVFDGAVNSGVGRSVKWLQQAVGATQDGILGPKTLAAIKQADDAQTIDNYLGLRLAFLKRLETWNTFGRGWQRRIDENKQYAKEDLA